MDLLTYAILKKKLSSSSTGVSDIRYENGALVFVLGDSSEVSVDLPQDEFRITPEGDLEIVTADGNTILYSVPHFRITESGDLEIAAQGNTIIYDGPHYDFICGGSA